MNMKILLIVFSFVALASANPASMIDSCDNVPACLARIAPVPVCGTDGENYASKCELEKMTCKSKMDIDVAYVGNCKVKIDCSNIQCLKFIAQTPVCGTDGKTYNSECELLESACKAGTDVKMVKVGKCDSDKKMPKKDCRNVQCNKMIAASLVCADNGKTYNSECEMKMAACQAGLTLTVKSHGECKCSEVCPILMSPLCGKDGITYPNDCELRKVECKTSNKIGVAYKGKCKAQESDVLKKDCSNVQCNKMIAPSPVCADDGKTYSSECEMKIAACEEGITLKVKSQGHCKCPHMCIAFKNAEVCADNGITYESPCHVEIARCESGKPVNIEYEGHCKCIERCLKIMNPLCGKDGKTYPNECELKKIECKNSKLIGVAHKGKCNDGVKCKNDCPKIMKKVCASNGKTYPNKCIMEAAACKDRTKLTVTHDGECKKPKPICPDVCIHMNAPVCGTDGKTYPSACDLEVARCKAQSELSVDFDGPCECSILCNLTYDPVCGTNGKTYANECVLKKDSCNKGDLSIKVASKGKCANYSVAAN